MKKILVCAVALLLLLGMTSCSIENESLTGEVETYEVGDAFSIILDSSMVQYDPIIPGYDAIFDSADAKVLVMKKNSSMDSAMEYAEYLVAGVDGAEDPVQEVITGLVWYEYDSSLLGVDFSGIAFVFYEDGDFWVVDMACEPEKYDEMQPYFYAWALSVSFDN